MKRRALICLVVIGVFCLSGCKRIELDESTEEAYVEYAVNAVINHDKNNMLKMEPVKIDTEEETKWISDDDVVGESDSATDNSNGGSISSSGNIDSSMEYVTLEKALGMDSISAKIKGIKECQAYPDNDELAFTMTATSGSRLVVVEMELTNISGTELTLNTKEGYAFKGIFNGVVRTNALQAFDYALNGNSHVIASGETKQMVLIYELNSERVTSVDKVVISVTRGDSTYNVSIK